MEFAVGRLSGRCGGRDNAVIHIAAHVRVLLCDVRNEVHLLSQRSVMGWYTL